MSARGQSLPRPRLTKRAAALVAFVLLLATASVVPLRQYAAQRGDLESLEQRVELLTRERDRLASRVEQFKDPAFLERIARECLGMVKPGEIGFVVVPEDETEPPETC